MKKEKITFMLEYVIYLTYMTLGAGLLKKFYINQTKHLLLSILVYIPILIVVYILAKSKRLTKKQMGLNFKNKKLLFILSLIYLLLLIISIQNKSYIRSRWIFFLICTGFTEEIIFRAYIYENSKRIYSHKKAIIINCLLFTLMHLPTQVIFQTLTFSMAMEYLFTIGIGTSLNAFIFIKIKDYTENIYIPILLHSILNYLPTIF